MRSKKRPASHSATRNRKPATLFSGPIITLTTDFGLSDYFVGSVKGVLLQRAPGVRLIDITHEIPPQDLITAAFVLKEASLYFPKGTVHLVVVDPGVGTDRRKIIAAEREQLYVAPDNGLLTYILQREGCRVYVVGETPLLPLEMSPTFAGRDHFAPIAALLAKGTPPDAFGPEIKDPVIIEGLLPKTGKGQMTGKIVYIDRFGNAITNVTEADLSVLFDASNLALRVKGVRLVGLKRNYAEGERGTGNLILNSSGHLEIFVPRGSARDLLGLCLLDEVVIEKKI
jgi:S-adenosylmethionine hydrolase